MKINEIINENAAAGINKMFNNLGDPVFANLQRVALLAMQGRQQEAAGRLQTVIKGADPAVQKKITDAVNSIKPVTINGRVADSSTLDKSKQHNDWIINTFIPWVQSLLGQQGVAEGKITLSTDPDWYGATVDNYQASGPVVNIPANQLVGFEPDDKMNQPKSKANVKKIVAGLKQGDKLPPLLVRKYKDGYQVLDGHHRFWAYKLSGTKSIPVQIVPAKDIEEISKQGVAEGVTEAFDQPRGIDWEQSEESEAVDAIARLSDGTALTVMFEPEAWTNDSPTDWSVSFWRGNSQEVTGAGNAQEVFATVLSAIRQFVHSHQPESIEFSASKDPQVDMAPYGTNINPESRAKLYDRMVDRYASAMGYQVQQQQGNDKVTYTLRRVKQSVAEGKQPGQPVVDAILKVMPVAQEIWFHGSRATGKHRRNSDTDILVVVPDDLVGDQYLGVVRILQKLSSHLDNYDIQPTKAGTNIHRIAQEEGRLLWSNKQDMAEGESNNTAISLSKLGKFHPGADTLAQFVPERATAQYALHPDKWESTFYSLTNKDSDKLKYYGPKKISIPPGTLVGDMAIANKFYRAKTPEEQEQYAELYKASLQPYPVDVSQYRMPELLIPKQGVAENFADGKNPQDKGDSKRHGVPTKASISTLRKVAKQGGRKGQLAHWMANMKSGRAKAKK